MQQFGSDQRHTGSHHRHRRTYVNEWRYLLSRLRCSAASVRAWHLRSRIQPTVILAARIILAHFFVSSTTNLPNSTGVIAVGTLPTLAIWP